MKAPTIDEFAVVIGIDWADKKHDVCEMVPGSSHRHYDVILNTPAVLNEWAMSLKKRYPNQMIAVACELKKGPLVYALSKFDHITLFPVNPSTLAKYRKAFTVSGAKNDPTDAYLQADILIRHWDQFRPLLPESVEVRMLAQFLEYRRKLVQDRVDLSNSITAYLKNYFPQALDWFKEKDTIIFCDFLTTWSTLAAIKKARKQTLFNFFNQHNSRYPAVNEKRFSDIKDAQALTNDPGVIEPNRIMVEVLIAQFKLLIESIDRLDCEIRQIYRTLEDRTIFNSFPGAGPQLAPRLLVAFGENRDRYHCASELQKYAGIAPVIEQSGQMKWIHWRYSCPTFLRQTFVEWAGLTIRYSFWAKAYYDQQISKGKPHNTVIRALAFKWIRIAFRCWKSNKPYDESTYLRALKKRGSPLLKFAANS